MWLKGKVINTQAVSGLDHLYFSTISTVPLIHFCPIYNSQIIRSMVSNSLISMICVRELHLHLPVLSFGILTLCYQNQPMLQGRRKRKKNCFSGCLDLFSLSRIPFMKTPGQAIIQKYNKNKVVIITAYILALSKKSEYDYISNITEKSLAFRYAA